MIVVVTVQAAGRLTIRITGSLPAILNHYSVLTAALDQRLVSHLLHPLIAASRTICVLRQNCSTTIGENRLDNSMRPGVIPFMEAP